MAAVDDRPRQLLIRTEDEDGDRVRVSVRDAGVGVDPQNLTKLLDAFYTTKSDGMGIGLSVSRSIIERHHGRLWAEPNDGPGATFFVFDSSEPKTVTEHHDEAFMIPKPSLVSVVDDDESIREALPDLLRQFGFAAEAFASAEAFLSVGIRQRNELFTSGRRDARDVWPRPSTGADPAPAEDPNRVHHRLRRRLCPSPPARARGRTVPGQAVQRRSPAGCGRRRADMSSPGEGTCRVRRRRRSCRCGSRSSC
jgi:hypothetical protein